MFGDKAVAGFVADAINFDYMIRDQTNPSGVALILIGRAGENSIVVAPGSNGNRPKTRPQGRLCQEILHPCLDAFGYEPGWLTQLRCFVHGRFGRPFGFFSGGGASRTSGQNRPDQTCSQTGWLGHDRLSREVDAVSLEFEHYDNIMKKC
jgi:hypothetical protein